MGINDSDELSYRKSALRSFPKNSTTEALNILRHTPDFTVDDEESLLRVKSTPGLSATYEQGDRLLLNEVFDWTRTYLLQSDRLAHLRWTKTLQPGRSKVRQGIFTVLATLAYVQGPHVMCSDRLMVTLLALLDIEIQREDLSKFIRGDIASGRIKVAASSRPGPQTPAAAQPAALASGRWLPPRIYSTYKPADLKTILDAMPELEAATAPGPADTLVGGVFQPDQRIVEALASSIQELNDRARKERAKALPEPALSEQDRNRLSELAPYVQAAGGTQEVPKPRVPQRANSLDGWVRLYDVIAGMGLYVAGAYSDPIVKGKVTRALRRSAVPIQDRRTGLAFHTQNVSRLTGEGYLYNGNYEEKWVPADQRAEIESIVSALLDAPMTLEQMRNYRHWT